MATYRPPKKPMSRAFKDLRRNSRNITEDLTTLEVFSDSVKLYIARHSESAYEACGLKLFRTKDPVQKEEYFKKHEEFMQRIREISKDLETYKRYIYISKEDLDENHLEKADRLISHLEHMSSLFNCGRLRLESYLKIYKINNENFYKNNINKK